MRMLWIVLVSLFSGSQLWWPPLRASPQATSVQARPSGAPSVIACLGDSITAGYGLDPGQAFPDVLQQELDGRRYPYVVVNLGVSGDGTQGGLARLPALLSRKPSIVVLELGANDGMRGLPVSIIDQSLDESITALQKAGVAVVLAGTSLPPDRGRDYVKAFDAMYRRLAISHNIALIPSLLEGVAEESLLMQHDGLHPNARGAKIVAETVFRALQPLLKETVVSK